MPQAIETFGNELTSPSAERSLADTSAALCQIAHHLRQPLSAIEAIAYLLSITLPPEETRAQEQLEQLQRLVQEADLILSDAIHYLRASPCHMVRADLKTLVASAISETRSPDGRNLAFTCDTCPAPVRVDAGQVAHMVRNLVTYFGQVAPAGQPVELSVSASEFEAGLTIRLAAAVCSAAEVESLLAPDRPHLGSGSGLAMASVSRIVDVHRGRIHLAAEPPSGIRMMVAFPLAR